MSGDEPRGTVIKIETRRVTRRVPGLGDAVFRAPGAEDELRIAANYASDEVDYRTFVNGIVAAALETPAVDPARVEALSERSRAIARVAVADAVGCLDEYKRLAGKGMSGDERVYRAMRSHYETQLERMRRATAAMTDNVVRLAERTRKVFAASGAFERIAQNQRQMERLARLHTRTFTPEYFPRLERIANQVAKLNTPSLVGRLPDPGIAARHTRAMDELARTVERSMRPTYFGALERLSEQINAAVQPRQIDAFSRVMEQIQRTIRPPQLDRFARAVEQALAPRYSERFARLFDQIGDRLGSAREQYAAWLERNWAEVYADPDNPPPVMFVLAALPMRVGLPLFRALKGTDEPFLDRVEEVLQEPGLIDVLEEAIQRNGDLDGVAKRYLVSGLEAVREQRYVDAAPPLALGLERAFKLVARERGIIDKNNRFLVAQPSGKRTAKKVEDLFVPLGLDKPYLRLLRSWVFGKFGNHARHGDLPESEHRRWVLRAVIGLVGWFEYCAEDEAPMDELVDRLELAPGGAEETA